MGKGARSTQEDYDIMLQAVAEARRGAGFVKSNPMVGAIVVYNGKIIAKAYHSHYGGLHAERKVLDIVKKKHSSTVIGNSTLYITLEPCSRQGKTPPCLPAVINSGMKRVVIGSVDPNPAEQGRSIRALRRHRIKVTTGVAKAECDYLIRCFAKWITTKLPFVLGKVGMSIDGKITHPANQRYITNRQSLERVHELRQEMNAILIGVNTVIRDNPSLNTRLEKNNLSHPLKVILDSRLRIPTSSKLLDSNTIVACLAGQSLKKRRAIGRTGADIIELSPDRQSGRLLFARMDIIPLLKELGRRQITSLLVEGGSYVFTILINKQAIDEFNIFMAPYLFGATRLPFTYALQYTVTLDNFIIEQLGDNILVRGYAKYS